MSEYGYREFYWVVTNGIRPDGSPVCIDSTEAIPVHFIQKPEPDAGGHYYPDSFGEGTDIKTDTVCRDWYDLNPNESSMADFGTWRNELAGGIISFRNGSITGTNMVNDTVDVTVLNPGSQYDWYQIIWREVSGLYKEDGTFVVVCSDEDTLRVTFAGTPSEEIGYERPFCYGYPAKIWSIAATNNELDPEYSNFNWTVSNDAEIVNQSINGDTIYVVWGTDTANLIHPVGLSVRDQYECFSLPGDTLINEPKYIGMTDSLVSATCGNANGEIYITDIDSLESSHLWLDSAYVQFNPIDSIINLPGGRHYSVQSKYNSWKDNQYCFDTLSLYIPDTGHVTARYSVSAGGSSQSFSHGDIESNWVFEPTEDIVAGATEVIFDASLSTNGRSYQWFLDYDDTDGDDNRVSKTGETVAYTYAEGGEYHIKLLAYSREGCVDTLINRYILVEGKSSIEIPNVFTPNGDNQNDEFMVKCESMKTVEGYIVNRWGQKVHEWSTFENRNGVQVLLWNGLINGDGNEAATGVYYYVIIAEGIDAAKYEEKGSLHLMRDK